MKKKSLKISYHLLTALTYSLGLVIAGYSEASGETTSNDPTEVHSYTDLKGDGALLKFVLANNVSLIGTNTPGRKPTAKWDIDGRDTYDFNINDATVELGTLKLHNMDVTISNNKLGNVIFNSLDIDADTLNLQNNALDGYYWENVTMVSNHAIVTGNDESGLLSNSYLSARQSCEIRKNMTSYNALMGTVSVYGSAIIEDNGCRTSWKAHGSVAEHFDSYDATHISIKNNLALAESGDSDSYGAKSYGGAFGAGLSIYRAYGQVALIENYAISTGTGSEAYGGLVNGSVTFKNNTGDLTIRGNHVQGERMAYGGAISTLGTSNTGAMVNIISNKNVNFTDNFTLSREGSYGAAIYIDGNLVCIQNNDKVLFEKNWNGRLDSEQNITRVELQSIYAINAESAQLSAPESKSIEFRDSVYISASNISLNGEYTDTSGNTIRQTGDVIFTGAYTENHIKEIKNGVAGTETEIQASRRSYLRGFNDLILYAGRLRVEDGADLTLAAVNDPTYTNDALIDIGTAEGSQATLLVKDATVTPEGGMRVHEGSTLQIEGVSFIGSVVRMEKGSHMNLVLSAANETASVANFTLLALDGINLHVQGTEYLKAGEYQLITLKHPEEYRNSQTVSNWDTCVESIIGCAANDLAWKDGVLTYTCNNTWNTAMEDGASVGNTAGNVLVVDGAAIKLIGNLTADTQQQGKGNLIIDSGSARMEEGSSVAGDIVFTGGRENDRQLIMATDSVVGRVVLQTSTNADSTISVETERELIIEAFEGNGNLRKEGDGTLEHAGESSAVEGKLEVKKGTLVNSGTLQFSEIMVTGGQLDNQGIITSVEINGGILSGSGVFGGLTMKAGCLVVGNSPGFQQYTAALKAEGGNLLFSVSGVAEAATSSCVGWESTVYSNIDMGDNSLYISDNTTLTIALGGSILEGFANDFSMILFSNVGNVDEFTPDMLTLLEKNTRFIVTEEAEGLFGEYKAGANANHMISSVTFSVSGTSIVISGYMDIPIIPEPATVSLSLLAVAAFAARRRRKV